MPYGDICFVSLLHEANTQRDCGLENITEGLMMVYSMYGKLLFLYPSLLTDYTKWLFMESTNIGVLKNTPTRFLEGTNIVKCELCFEHTGRKKVTVGSIHQ